MINYHYFPSFQPLEVSGCGRPLTSSRSANSLPSARASGGSSRRHVIDDAAHLSIAVQRVTRASQDFLLHEQPELLTSALALDTQRSGVKNHTFYVEH